MIFFIYSFSYSSDNSFFFLDFLNEYCEEKSENVTEFKTNMFLTINIKAK